jgi:hypothetical protein
MKKLLITALAFLLTLCVSSCAVKTGYTKPQLTNIPWSDVCAEPIETWHMRVMPMPVLMLRYQECSGVDDLLVVVMPTEDFGDEKRILTTTLAVLYYVDYLNREHTRPNATWEANLVNREVLDGNSASGLSGHDVYYYELVPVDNKK